MYVVPISLFPDYTEMLMTKPPYRSGRSLSLRSKRDQPQSTPFRFRMGPFHTHAVPETSRKLNKLIKAENSVVDAYDEAGRERILIASLLSDWGESTEDEAMSDVTDRLGVLLEAIGEQEDAFSMTLEDYRNILKEIRDTQSSVQPTRDQKDKITDEIEKIKYKDPNSSKLLTLEQELVRAEAQNLVAEAQLTNVVRCPCNHLLLREISLTNVFQNLQKTRSKFKQAFDLHLASLIERSEKQVLLARHARRVLNCLDDSPVIPGDSRRQYEHEAQTRQIVQDAENDMNSYEKNIVPVENRSAELSAALLATARNNVEQYTGDIIPNGEADKTGAESVKTAEEQQPATNTEAADTSTVNASTADGASTAAPPTSTEATTEPEGERGESSGQTEAR